MSVGISKDEGVIYIEYLQDKYTEKYIRNDKKNK